MHPYNIYKKESEEKVSNQSLYGNSDEMLKEYSSIVDGARNEKNIIEFKRFSDTDVKRLETLFLQMNKEQQEQQVVIFVPAPPPLPRVTPTLEQMQQWREPSVYGVWIDGKRVANSVLAEYDNTDFDHVFVSRLNKNATNYGKHDYQVDLMTKEHYADYLEKASKRDFEYIMLSKWGK